MKVNTKFLLLMTASLVMAGCSYEGEGNGDVPSTSEELLNARGDWQMVEQDTDGAPESKHMAARKKVDPNNKSDHHSYTSKPDRKDIADNMHFRVLKLERQMKDLREDFDKLLPPLAETAKAEMALGQTITDIQARQREAAAAHQAMYEGGVSAAPQPPATKPAVDTAKIQVPQHKPQPQVVAASPAPVSSGAAQATGLRLGQHPDKVRMVVDVTSAAKFQADLDNGEKILLVDLPGLAWTGAAQQSFGGNPLVKSYTAQDNGRGGTALAVELKQPVKIVWSAALAPNHVYGHRVVLDLAAQ